MLKKNSRVDYIYYSDVEPKNTSVLWLKQENDQFSLKFFADGKWQDITGSSGLSTSKDMPIEVTIKKDNSGIPAGTATVEKGTLKLAFYNIQGAKGVQGVQGEKGTQGSLGKPFTWSDFTQEQLSELRGDPGEQGPEGPQGATGIYDPNTQQFLTTLETTTGQSQTTTMTQKAITDALDNQYNFVLEGVEGNCYKDMACNNNKGVFQKTGWGYFKDPIPVSPGDSVTWTYKTVSESAKDIGLTILDENMERVGGYGQNTAATKKRDFTVPEDGAYIMCCFQLTVEVPLKINGVDYPRVIPYPALNDIKRFEEVEKQITSLETKDERRLHIKSGIMYNTGGGTEAGVGWSICTNYIPCTPGDIVQFRYGKKDGHARIVFYDANYQYVDNYAANEADGIRAVKVYAPAAYLRTSWYETLGGEANTNPLIVAGQKYYIDDISKIRQMEEDLYSKDESHGTIGEYYPEQVKDIIAMGTVPSSSFKRFWFIHTSDNHGSIFGYAEDFIQYCKAKFLVNTGDLVTDRFSDSGNSNFKTISSAVSTNKPTYLVLGNHDYAYAPSKQAIFNKFYGDPETEGTVNYHNAQTGGVVTEHTWYSVDYNTEKVKCIFLDMNDGWPDEGFSTRALGNYTIGNMSSEQIQWFIEELQAARTASLHVCIFIHVLGSSIDPSKTINEFTDNCETGQGTSELSFLHDIVDKFMTGGTGTWTYRNNTYTATFQSGGHLISWFCGHAHMDSAGWIKNYPNQFAVVVTRPNSQSLGGGMYEGDGLGVHWNFVAIDTNWKYLSIYRVGNQKTVWGINRRSFRIQYK